MNKVLVTIIQSWKHFMIYASIFHVKHFILKIRHCVCLLILAVQVQVCGERILEQWETKIANSVWTRLNIFYHCWLTYFDRTFFFKTKKRGWTCAISGEGLLRGKKTGIIFTIMEGNVWFITVISLMGVKSNL